MGSRTGGRPPAPDPRTPAAKLAVAGTDVYFPNWTKTLGWRPAGARTDTLRGRRVYTVYYDHAGRRVTYSIVGGAELDQPAGRAATVNGYHLRIMSDGSRAVISWDRDGHTCVLSATGVSVAELQLLAGWRL